MFQQSPHDAKHESPSQAFSTRLGDLHVDFRVSGIPSEEERQQIARVVQEFLTTMATATPAPRS